MAGSCAGWSRRTCSSSTADVEAASVAGAIHDVFGLADRISVILQGKLVGTVDKTKVTKDEVLVMIIIGKLPEEVSATELAELVN